MDRVTYSNLPFAPSFTSFEQLHRPAVSQ